MQWYDDQVLEEPVEDQGYRRDGSSQRNLKDKIDDSKRYSRQSRRGHDDLDLEGMHCLGFGGDNKPEDDIGDDGGASPGGDRQRQGKMWNNGAREEIGHDAVILRLLEKELSKHSTKSRRPSTTHVDLLEHSAALKMRMFGSQNSATRKALRDTIVACNSLAMSALGRGKTRRCKDLLARAFEIASDARLRGGNSSDRSPKQSEGGDIPPLQVLTLNNTACLHRRLGEPKRALRYLRQAAEVGRRSGGSEHLEVTHVNACAVLSELGRHEEALEHARSAVFYGQEREEVGGGRRGKEWDEEQTEGSGSRQARLATLAVSYYNLAVELEYTRRYEACLRWYHEAVKLARDPDVRNEELLKTFQSSYAGARKKHECCAPRRSSGCKSSNVGKNAPFRGLCASNPLPRDFRFMPSWFWCLTDGRSRGNIRSPGDTVKDGYLPCEVRPRGSPIAGNDDVAPPKTLGSGNELHTNWIPNTSGFQSQLVEWPHLGRVERQRAGDKRRSKTNALNQGSGAKTSAKVTTSDTVGNSGWIHQRRFSPASGEKRLAPRNVRRRSTESSEQDAKVRFRPASGGTIRGSGDGLLPELSKKRPASAEISTGRYLGGRIRLDQVEASATIPETSESSVEPTWQPLGGRSGLGAPTADLKVKQRDATADGRWRRHHPPDSRRPKSAHSRLEEGSRPERSVSIGEVAGGNSNPRVSRPRSCSANTLWYSTSQPTLFESNNKVGRASQSMKGRGSKTNTEKKLMSGLGAGSKQILSSVRRTKVSRSDSDTIVDVDGHAHSGRSNNSVSLFPVSEIDHSRRKILMAGAAQKTSGLPYNSRCPAGQARAKRKRKPKGAVRSICSGSRDTFSPHLTSHSSDGREARLDNGRDGKFYLGSEPDEQHGELAVLGSNNENALLDNGRDGKLYLDGESDEQQTSFPCLAQEHEFFRVDSARDGKQHLGAEPDGQYNKSTTLEMRAEKQRRAWKKGSDEEIVGAVKNIAGGAPSRTASTAADHDDNGGTVHLGTDSSNRRIEAAMTIREALVRAVIRQYKRNTKNTKGHHTVSKETESWKDRKKGPDKVLPEVITSKSRSPQQMVSPTAIDEGIQQHCANVRRSLERENLDRRVLAASTVRVWLARWLQRRRFRRLKLKLEIEIHAIATTRIQSVVRGARERRVFRRMAQAVIVTQRVVRGRRGRLLVKELAQTRIEEHLPACETIQRQFRGYQGRQHVSRIRQIFWEGAVARHGAAGVMQSSWLRHKKNSLVQQRRTWAISEAEITSPQPAANTEAMLPTRTRTHHNAPTSPPLKLSHRQILTCPTTVMGAVESASIPPESRVPPAARRYPDFQHPQLWRGAETHAPIFALWSAFTSLLTAAATRRAVRRSIATALLTPAATTLAIFNQDRRRLMIAESHSHSSPSSSRLILPPDPASFACALKFKKEMLVSVHRTAGIARAQTASLTAVHEAARRCISDGSDDGATDEPGCGGATRAAEREAVFLVLESVQDCWTLLTSSSNSLADLDERAAIDEKATSERLTEILSGTLQELIAGLGRINSPLVAQDIYDGHLHTTADNSRYNTSAPHLHLALLPPPEALVRVLISSAVASLMSHSDIIHFIGTTHGFEGGDMLLEGWDAEGNGEYARLTGEIYALMLVLPMYTYPKYDGYYVAKSSGDLPDTSMGEGGGRHDNNHNTNGGFSRNDVEPSQVTVSQNLFPSDCCLQGGERLRLLWSVIQLTDETAEELVCSMLEKLSLPNEKKESQGEYNASRSDQDDSSHTAVYGENDYVNIVQDMTRYLWELAWRASRPMDTEEEEGGGGVQYVDRAACLVQGWLRRQWGRRKKNVTRQRAASAIVIQRFLTRRRKHITYHCGLGGSRQLPSFSTKVSAPPASEKLENKNFVDTHLLFPADYPGHTRNKTSPLVTENTENATALNRVSNVGADDARKDGKRDE